MEFRASKTLIYGRSTTIAICNITSWSVVKYLWILDSILIDNWKEGRKGRNWMAEVQWQQRLDQSQIMTMARINENKCLVKCTLQ